MYSVPALVTVDITTRDNTLYCRSYEGFEHVLNIGSMKAPECTQKSWIRRKDDIEYLNQLFLNSTAPRYENRTFDSFRWNNVNKIYSRFQSMRSVQTRTNAWIDKCLKRNGLFPLCPPNNTWFYFHDSLLHRSLTNDWWMFIRSVVQFIEINWLTGGESSKDTMTMCLLDDTIT